VSQRAVLQKKEDIAQGQEGATDERKGTALDSPLRRNFTSTKKKIPWQNGKNTVEGNPGLKEPKETSVTGMLLRTDSARVSWDLHKKKGHKKNGKSPPEDQNSERGGGGSTTRRKRLEREKIKGKLYPAAVLWGGPS